MTIGASGVKLYTAMDYATIFNVDFSSEFELSKYVKWNFHILYSKGKDSDNNNLPLINPVSYRTSLNYNKQKISVSLECIGNTTQTQFGSIYGETSTADFAILNTTIGYKFLFNSSKLYLKVGIENTLDGYYTTYSDWNKIPQMGRNFFINLQISL
jgi:iron complex outermembrane receptor protein